MNFVLISWGKRIEFHNLLKQSLNTSFADCNKQLLLKWNANRSATHKVNRIPIEWAITFEITSSNWQDVIRSKYVWVNDIHIHIHIYQILMQVISAMCTTKRAFSGIDAFGSIWYVCSYFKEFRPSSCNSIYIWNALMRAQSHALATHWFENWLLCSDKIEITIPSRTTFSLVVLFRMCFYLFSLFFRLARVSEDDIQNGILFNLGSQSDFLSLNRSFTNWKSLSPPIDCNLW